jgi:hypothetical protein
MRSVGTMVAPFARSSLLRTRIASVLVPPSGVALIRPQPASRMLRAAFGGSPLARLLDDLRHPGGRGT